MQWDSRTDCLFPVCHSSNRTAECPFLADLHVTQTSSHQIEWNDPNATSDVMIQRVRSQRSSTYEEASYAATNSFKLPSGIELKINSHRIYLQRLQVLFEAHLGCCRTPHSRQSSRYLVLKYKVFRSQPNHILSRKYH